MPIVIIFDGDAPAASNPPPEPPENNYDNHPLWKAGRKGMHFVRREQLPE